VRKATESSGTGKYKVIKGFAWFEPRRFFHFFCSTSVGDCSIREWFFHMFGFCIIPQYLTLSIPLNNKRPACVLKCYRKLMKIR